MARRSRLLPHIYIYGWQVGGCKPDGVAPQGDRTFSPLSEADAVDRYGDLDPLPASCDARRRRQNREASRWTKLLFNRTLRGSQAARRRFPP